MKDIFKYFWGLCLSLLLLTGCYREDVAYIHNHIDNLELKTITDQIEAMKDGIAEMQALQEQITPIVKALQDAKDGIAKDIAALQERIEAEGTASTELQAQLISLQSQYKALDAAYKTLSDLRLEERTEELEALVSSSNGELKDRLTALETAAQAMATIKELAALGTVVTELRAVVDVLPAEFEGEFDDAFARCKESVLQWISDSEAFLDLFNDYYKIEEIKALLDVLREADAARADELSELKKAAEKTDKDIRDLVEDAVSGSGKKLGERMDAVESNVKDLSSRIDSLYARVIALEKLYDVVGDYSAYKSNLISDILKLQEAVGKDDTLVSLANTLKMVLSQSEQSYYDFAKIVNDIYSFDEGFAGREEKLKSYEEIVAKSVDVEQFIALRDKIAQLSSDIDELISRSESNISALEAVAERVSDIVAKWTDATFDQISSVTAEIVKLKEEDARLLLVLEELKQKDSERNEANHKEIVDLLAKVNESLAALKVEEYIQKIGNAQSAVDGINKMLDECGVGEIKGLQAFLSSLDSRISAVDADIAKIWAAIGTETLSIEGSLINAINVLNSRFGGIEGIKGITETLHGDLALIQVVLSEIMGGEDAPSLTELKALLDKLSEDISGKADKSALPAIEGDIKGIQQNLVDYVVVLNGKLADYILSEDAAKVYATTTLLSLLIDSYNAYVGEFDKAFADQSGTVIAAVAALDKKVGELESSISEVAEKIKTINGEISGINGNILDINGDLSDANDIIGTGTLGEWAKDLTAAVNYLYSLVGDKSVSEQAEAIAIEQATQITQGIISTLVQAILGEDGDASDIKSLLDGFASSFSDFSDSLDDLFESVGDISGLKDAQNPDIAHMITNIKAVLATLSDTYAAKQHKHSMSEVEGLNSALDIISASLSGVSNKLDTLDKYVKETLVGLIDALTEKFDGYTTPEDVNALIAASQNILAGIVLNGDDTKFNAWFASLNLTSLSNRIKAILEKDIAEIIKEGGTIDSRAKVLVDKAFDDLNIEDYLTKTGFDDKMVEILKDYATNESVSSMIATATAIAALDIALGDKNYTYNQFNVAVQDVYEEIQDKFTELQNSLNGHISVFNQYTTDFNGFKATFEKFLQENFEDVKAKLDEIYPLIGAGFEGKTITGVIEEIQGDITGIGTLISSIKETLDGVVGREATDKGLIDGLEEVRDKLISALFGGTIPPSGIPDGGYVADFENRIAALEDVLSNVGFDTIKNSEGKTLAEVISGINGQITELKNTIGGDYGPGNTLAKAISDLNSALETLVKTEDFDSRTKTLSDNIQSLIDALGGQSALRNLSEVSQYIDGIKNALDHIKADDKNTSAEEHLASIQNSLQTLYSYVDTTGTSHSGTIVKRIQDLKNTINNLQVLSDDDLTAIAGELADITYEIVQIKIQTGFYDATIVSGVMGLIETAHRICDIMGWDFLDYLASTLVQQIAPFATSDPNYDLLDTDDKSSLVAAINELVKIISETEFVTSGELDELRKEILDGSQAQSLSALVLVFNKLKGLVGTSTNNETVFDALKYLQSIKDVLGENKTGYSDVWSALSDLNAALIGCLYKINSLAFMPDYEDGMATYSRSSGVTMEFKINATGGFFTRFGTASFDVNGYLKTASNRGKGASIKGTASISGDVLTVTYGADQFSNLGSAAQVAVAIVDGVGEVFISDYISLHL